MNQRMTIGALVLLIAASGVTPTKPSPQMATLAGGYTLVLRGAEGDQQLTLVLGPDGSARLTIETPGEKPPSTTQSGVWTVDSGEVKVAATGASKSGKRQMTLGIQGDSLVWNENDSSSNRGESLIFRRK